EVVVTRQHRLFLRGSHISEDEAVALFERIPGLPIGTRPDTAIRFDGLVQAVTFRIEQPAVIAAADAVLLDAPEMETGAAVSAALHHQSRAPLAIAKENQILAEDPHAARRRCRIG